MTTIAYRNGEVAADTQATGYDCKFRITKLRRLPCGGVVGGCGGTTALVRAMDYLVRGRKGSPPKLKGAMLFVAYGDGRVTTIEDNTWAEIECCGPVALGSGMQAALAAMNHFGATAEQAVMAAASVDPNTSAPVDVYRVEPVKRRKRK